VLRRWIIYNRTLTRDCCSTRGLNHFPFSSLSWSHYSTNEVLGLSWGLWWRDIHRVGHGSRLLWNNIAYGPIKLIIRLNNDVIVLDWSRIANGRVITWLNNWIWHALVVHVWIDNV
jgi:hypothetical protein